MSIHVPWLLLFLFVIAQGIACGAGLYEQRIVVPQWFGRTAAGDSYVNAGEMRRADTGRRFWGFVTTGPLTLLTMANLVAAWQSSGSSRPLWLGSVLVTLLERIGTFAYFIPAAIGLMNAKEPLTQDIKARALQWSALNRIRLALSFLGWVLGLLALAV